MLSRWESGRIRPSLDDLFKISEATGKPVSWLLDLTDEQGVPLRAERIADELKAKVDELMREASLQTLTPLQEELLDVTKGLDQEKLRRIVELARKIAQEEN